MAWVRFSANFNWVQPGFTIAYKAGMALNVTRACADEAISKGVAVKIAAPRKEITDGHESKRRPHASKAALSEAVDR
ncbi:hypothetical protein CN234_21460 [Sinorhizobium meliloti]|nr:hypothetical protein CN234_21460 [Sinorhizobium meliloti]RVL14749.1 hypothetical protein CN147_30335 [Sinorhizobium meliloti]RVP96755.1 hypothetical protein CN069_25945 [Sinorhizobium meliloti]